LQKVVGVQIAHDVDLREGDTHRGDKGNHHP
jgi:hypothetical protein